MIHRIDVSEKFIDEIIELMEEKQATLNREILFAEIPATKKAIKQYQNFRLGEYILHLKDQTERSKRVILLQELQNEYLGLRTSKDQKKYIEQSALAKEIEDAKKEE